MQNINLRRNLRVALMGTLALGVATAAWAGATSTKITSRASISSGVHLVPDGAPLDGSLDPRAETFFRDKVTSNSNESWSFKANYNVVSANRTTIVQFLQADPTQSGADLRKPVMFLTAFKSNGNVSICNGNPSSFSGCSGTSWSGLSSNFTISMSGTGKSASVTIGGTKKTVSLIRTPAGVSRTNGTLELRWGAYHHHKNNSGALSKAEIGVSGITETGFD